MGLQFIHVFYRTRRLPRSGPRWIDSMSRLQCKTSAAQAMEGSTDSTEGPSFQVRLMASSAASFFVVLDS